MCLIGRSFHDSIEHLPRLVYRCIECPDCHGYLLGGNDQRWLEADNIWIIERICCDYATARHSVDCQLGDILYRELHADHEAEAPYVHHYVGHCRVDGAKARQHFTAPLDCAGAKILIDDDLEGGHRRCAGEWVAAEGACMNEWVLAECALPDFGRRHRDADRHN